MATEVILPKVDMVMETATFVEWLKQEGEQVEKGQPLFVILTDKAAMEIEAPASGILSSLKARPDDVIPVSETIAYILEPGEESPVRKSGISDTGKREVEAVGSEPTISEFMSRDGGLPETREIQVEDRPRATPVARRLAADLDIDLATIQGRGPRGRIHRADVLEAAENRESQVSGLSAPIPQTRRPGESFANLQIPLPDARQREIIPLVGPRRIIAQRMAYSASTAPHISLTVHVDMSEATRMRSKVKEQLEGKSGYSLSFTAIIARAVASLLPSHAYLNASFTDEKIILWEDVHLGIAMSLNDYLIVPVIREAQTKNLEQIVTSLGELVKRAREKRLAPAEMSGSTFTISNLGMYGIEQFTAIINPPESAILAVGAIVDTYIKIDGEITTRPLMSLTVCTDHRVVDGAAAANFLIGLKNTLENPYLLI